MIRIDLNTFPFALYIDDLNLLELAKIIHIYTKLKKIFTTEANIAFVKV